MNSTTSEANAVPSGKDAIPMALEYIHAHCGQELTLSEAARSVWMSPSYFSRLFTQTTGMNFSDYLRLCRLEKAKVLLTESALTIGEIAREVGFCSAAYFIKLFSAAYGMTPGEFRRRK